jgi:hypothetical protein
MVTAQHSKVASCIGEGPFFDVFHPGAVHAQGHLVLLFTGYTARMTANALAVVDKKTKFHGLSSSRLTSAIPAACA